MLGKLLGKKSGYYLELSEDEISAIPEPVAAPVSEAPVTQQVPVVETASSVAQTADTSKTAKKKASKPEVQAAATTSSISDPIELIRTAIAASANKPKPAPPAPVPTFDYTTPVAKASRRRPGPSMSPFKSMAKDMKKTTAGF